MSTDIKLFSFRFFKSELRGTTITVISSWPCGIKSPMTSSMITCNIHITGQCLLAFLIIEYYLLSYYLTGFFFQIYLMYLFFTCPIFQKNIQQATIKMDTEEKEREINLTEADLAGLVQAEISHFSSLKNYYYFIFHKSIQSNQDQYG